MNADNKTELMEDIQIYSRGLLQEVEDLFWTARIKTSLTVAFVRESWCGLQKGIYTQSCRSGNRKWFLWDVGNVMHTAMQFTAFASVGCRTIVLHWLLLGFLLGFEEFIKHNEGNKPPFAEWKSRSKRSAERKYRLHRHSFRRYFLFEFSKGRNNALTTY